ncbi:hypothetical protein BFJ70_g16472 [Fusarium oxysporum]|nr:hypothetical protein NW765_015507 [Fusarium oxysporum]KAJ4263718.1 hypothetical protein NW764_016059 [Fusarium oxysporum]RKL10770.1 hypothetical protein BFJ70_g16472 [Fusarium oxysporum]
MKVFTVILFPVPALGTQAVPQDNSVNLEKKEQSRGAAAEDFEKLAILILVIFIQLC